MRIPKKRDESQGARQIDSVVLKKYCILGSIEYTRDAKALGKYKAIIKPNCSHRIYEVKSKVNADEKILLSFKGETDFRKFPKETGDTELLVRDEMGRVKRRIMYHFDKKGNAKSYTLSGIMKIIADETTHDKEEQLEKIREKLQDIEPKSQAVFCIGALDSKSGYGFNIYQIYVSRNAKTGATEYWLPLNRPFESYEDESLQTFFNGDK